jgi:hypothetical protein
MTELPQVNFDVPAPKLAFRYYERASRSVASRSHLLPLSGRIAGSSAYGIKAGTPFLAGFAEQIPPSEAVAVATTNKPVRIKGLACGLQLRARRQTTQ